MVWMNTAIMVLYFVLTGVIAIFLIKLWLKEKNIQKLILISVILIPFILRVFGIK